MVYPGPKDEVHPATKPQLATKKRNRNARKLEGSFNGSIVARIQVWQKVVRKRDYFRAAILAEGEKGLSSAATDTDKTRTVVISRRLARSYFLLRLVVVHPLVDALKNLSLRQSGIF